jgi:hypothetical protein
LSGYPDRIVALFSKRTFIDHQEVVVRFRKHSIHVLGDLIQNGSITPRRVRHEMLILLIVRIWDHLGHALHVAFFGLHQPQQVLLGLLDHIAGSRDETISESRMKANHSLGEVPQIPFGPHGRPGRRRRLRGAPEAMSWVRDAEGLHPFIRYGNCGFMSRKKRDPDFSFRWRAPSCAVREM